MTILTLLGLKKKIFYIHPKSLLTYYLSSSTIKTPLTPPLLNKTLTNETTNMLIEKNYFWRMKHEIDVSEASHEVRLHIFYCFSDFDDIDNYLILLLMRYSSFYVRIHLLGITWITWRIKHLKLPPNIKNRRHGF